MASLKDLAAECGVSIATVSKALNGQKDVSPKTRERIRQKAREIGYFPNSAAKALKTNEMALNQGFPGLDSYAKSLGEGCENLSNAIAKMEACLEKDHEDILDAMAELRKVVDGLERIVPDDCWPLPKYREMLFIY